MSLAFQDQIIALGVNGLYRDYIVDEMVGERPAHATIPPIPLIEIQMATYDPVEGFIACHQDCYSWKAPETSWSLMSISLPYEVLSSTQLNLADGRIWILGGKNSTLPDGKFLHSVPKCILYDNNS